MKKIMYIVCLAAAVLCCGCAKPEVPENEESTTKKQMESQTESMSSTEKETETETQTVAYVGNENPVKMINFYYKDKTKGARVLVDGYEGPFTKGKDIAEYELYATNEEKISIDYFRDVWYSYWDLYPGAEAFKLGYEITFTVEDGKVIKEKIMSPKDTESFFDYIEVYLYDDTNQPKGQWYSHVLESQMNEKTRLTTIKLTAGKDIEKVGDEISVTVFIYKDDKDFHPETGEYIGGCKKTIKYIRK